MLRFTIRDLLWLTAMLAMGLGWWADRSALNKHWRVLFLRAFANQGKNEPLEITTPIGETFHYLPKLSTPAPNQPSE